MKNYERLTRKHEIDYNTLIAYIKAHHLDISRIEEYEEVIYDLVDYYKEITKNGASYDLFNSESSNCHLRDIIDEEDLTYTQMKELGFPTLYFDFTQFDDEKYNNSDSYWCDGLVDGYDSLEQYKEASCSAYQELLDELATDIKYTLAEVGVLV